MKALSKKEIINKKRPTIEIVKIFRGRPEKIKETNYSIKIGEELNLIAEHLYAYKDGTFWTVKDKNGEFHYFDTGEIDFIFEHLT